MAGKRALRRGLVGLKRLGRRGSGAIYDGYLHLLPASQTGLCLARYRFPSFGQSHDPAGGAGLDKAIAEDRVLAARSKRVRLLRQASAQRVGVGRGAPHHLQRRGAEREGCWA